MTKSTSEGSTRRSTPLLLAGGAIAASVLVLGVNGTLSAWSTAIIENTTNTAQAASAVALSEANETGTVCVDTASTSTNSAQCGTINKYGGTTTPLEPGTSQTATVTLTNTGTSNGTLSIAAGVCSKTGGVTTDVTLCDHMTVALECPASTAIGTAATLNAWTSGGARTVGTLAAGQSIVCTFTVSLPEATPTIVAGQTASQPLTWTLTAA